MIIITKTPSEIKSFLNTLTGCDSLEKTQHVAQGLYADSVFDFERGLKSGRGTNSVTSCNRLSSAGVNVILSTNRKHFIINRNYSVCLRIYKLRISQSTKLESILVEPFYPGFQALLTDIYGILRDAPRSAVPSSYRFSALHTYRMRQNLRERFRSELPQYFTNGVLSLEAFDIFHDIIHQLAPYQLQALFRAHITFVSIAKK